MAKRARKKTPTRTNRAVSTVPRANPSLPTPGRCHLLELPPELRLNIYDLVAGFEISQSVFDHYVGTADPLQYSRQTPVRLPVANLAMTCSLIANEVRRHTLPEKQRFAIVGATTGPREFSPLLYFQRAPCPVVDLAALKLMINLKLGRDAVAAMVCFRYVLRCMRDQLLLRLLSNPSSSFNNTRSALEVQVYVHVSRDADNGQSKSWYKSTTEGIRSQCEEEKGTFVLKKFSSDPWVDRPEIL